MAYNSNSKVITAPVDFGDIANALGMESLDLGTLCLAYNINIWSKNKPISHSEKGILTEQQKKKKNWGVEVIGILDSPVLDSNMAKMHQTSFVYDRPNGGSSSPFRTLDFDGYCHIAEPNPYASFEDEKIEAYYNDSDFARGGIDGVSVKYSETNEYGIDFVDMISSSATLENALNKVYPCILVTDKFGNTYFTALSIEDSNGNAIPCTIANRNLSDVKPWFVKMSKPSYSAVSLGSMSPPWTSEQDGMKATLFLLESASTIAPQLTAGVGGINFHNYWIKADGLMGISVPIVLPGAIGLEMSLKRYFSGVIFALSSISASANASGNVVFAVSTKEITGGTSTNSIEVTISLRVNGATYTQKKNYPNGWPSFNMATLITTNILHMQGTTYTGAVTVTTKDGTAQNVRTEEFTLKI